MDVLMFYPFSYQCIVQEKNYQFLLSLQILLYDYLKIARYAFQKEKKNIFSHLLMNLSIMNNTISLFEEKMF